MSKSHPDHHDAELVLRAYDLRRESVMRQSRDQINRTFWPTSYEEFLAVTKPDHQINAAFRQTSTYWEMIYSFVRHGVVHPDFFVENNGEGILLYAKVEPYLEQFRKDVAPTSFLNAEWVVTQTDAGKKKLQIMRGRVAQTLQQKLAKKA